MVVFVCVACEFVHFVLFAVSSSVASTLALANGEHIEGSEMHLAACSKHMCVRLIHLPRHCLFISLSHCLSQCTTHTLSIAFFFLFADLLSCCQCLVWMPLTVTSL